MRRGSVGERAPVAHLASHRAGRPLQSQRHQAGLHRRPAHGVVHQLAHQPLELGAVAVERPVQVADGLAGERVGLLREREHNEQIGA
jgi:hypothetical protein